MSSVTNKHRSRFGFHPCSQDVYLQLKVLHRHYWETLRQFHKWHRWNRKLPENRVGSEPPFCKVFVENQPWAKRVTRKGEAGFKLYSKTVVDHDLLRLYHEARMPREEPIENFSREVLNEIDRLYRNSSEYFNEEVWKEN